MTNGAGQMWLWPRYQRVPQRNSAAYASAPDSVARN